MKVFFRRITALAAGLMLAAGGAVQAEEADPTVVRVGRFSYPLSVVRNALDTDLAVLTALNSTYYTEEDLKAQTDATIHRFIGNGLLENKLSEAGRNDFTPEEEEILKAAAREQYRNYWDEAYRQLTGSGRASTEEEVTRMMDLAGYTVDAFYREYRMTERRNRAIELFCPDVTVSESQVKEYYETMFLRPDREKYEHNIEAYETEVLATGSEAFFTPEGYRYIRQVLLAYPEEIARPLRNDQARLSAAAQNLGKAVENLAKTAAAAEKWEDLTGARDAYNAAAEEAGAARTAYDTKRKALALPLLQETLDTIRAEYDAGTDFVTIIQTFSTDKSDRNLAKEGGYPFHPQSTQWPENFIAAAAGLQKPGDISGPVFTDAGIHILYYAGDIPAGEHVLTAEEQETLNAAALYYQQSQALEKCFEDWMDDYEIETHPELLVY